MLKNYTAICLFVLIFALSGCSSKIDLAYEPIIEKKASNHTNLVVQPIGEDNIYFPLNPDAQKGVKVGKIYFESSFALWANNALQSELANAGYSILEIGDPAEKVYLICHGPFSQKDGHLNVQISVKQDDKELFSKVYYSKQPTTFRLYKLFFGIKSRVNKMFRRSLQEISSQFVEDLNTVLIPTEKDLSPSHQ